MKLTRRHLLRGLCLAAIALLVRESGCASAAPGVRSTTQPAPPPASAGPKTPVEVSNTGQCGPGRPDNNCFNNPMPGTCLSDTGRCNGTETVCRFEWRTSGACGASGQCSAGGYCQCPGDQCGPSCGETCGAGQVCQSEHCVRAQGGSECARGCQPGEECRDGQCVPTCPPCPGSLRCVSGRCVDNPPGPRCNGR